MPAELTAIVVGTIAGIVAAGLIIYAVTWFLPEKPDAR